MVQGKRTMPISFGCPKGIITKQVLCGTTKRDFVRTFLARGIRNLSECDRITFLIEGRFLR
jgi:hypothetical protein